MEPAGQADDLSARLRAYVAERLGKPVDVKGINRLGGGASRETWP